MYDVVIGNAFVSDSELYSIKFELMSELFEFITTFAEIGRPTILRMLIPSAGAAWLNWILYLIPLLIIKNTFGFIDASK